MQQKLCLWLAIVVLLGALAGGNPFLPCCDGDAGAPRAPREPRETGSGSSPSTAPAALRAPAAPIHDAAPALAVRDVAQPPPSAERALFALDSKPRASRAAPAEPGHAQPVHAVAPAARAGLVPMDASGAPVCPDPALAPLVVRVDRDAAGQPVWVLRDGRRLVRNPRAAAPLLVPAR